MPLSGWPDGYAAWVVSSLTALKAARNRRESDEMKKITKKSKPKGGGIKGITI